MLLPQKEHGGCAQKTCVFLSFLIRTVTVGMGISPIQLSRADFTADVEFHQPPKSRSSPAFRTKKGYHTASLYGFKYGYLNYSMISPTTPEPTVLPPSRIAKRRPFSIAIGEMSSTVISTLSPGRHISTPSGRLITPVTSVVLK